MRHSAAAGGLFRPGAQRALICLLLAAGTLAVYAQVAGFDFVNFDDDVYVTDNPHLRPGSMAAGLGWALTTFHGSNWHPLTWLSLMIDARMSGDEAAGSARHVIAPSAARDAVAPCSARIFHLTSCGLHVLATLLAFLALERLTHAPWRSALTAALFAVHPLHVESVAWIAERKDVLSGVFFFLTLACYAWYAERPTRGRYLAVALCMALGLMAKPMLVSLPFILLLLDVWPLRRWPGWTAPPPRRVILEKIPLVVLSGISCLLTFVAQSRGGAIKTLQVYSLGARLENALVAYVLYLGKTIWPAGLAVFYPHPIAGATAGDMTSMASAAVAAVILGAITVFVVRVRARWPHLAVGWLWFLVMLVPVIGLVQVGEQSMADRYTYLPLVGVFIALAWSLPDPGFIPLARGGDEATRATRRRAAGRALAAASLVAVIAFVVAAHRQVAYWRDGLSLFRRAAQVTHANRVVSNNLGSALLKLGRAKDAVAPLTEAIALDPAYADAHANLAGAYLELGRVEEAIAQGRSAVRLRPDHPGAHANLGLALVRAGQPQEAGVELGRALALRPATSRYLTNLGVALQLMGRKEEALARFTEAVRIDPGSVEARLDLGGLLVETGRVDEGIAAIAQVLAEHPTDPRAKQFMEIARARKAANPSTPTIPR